MTQHGRLFVVRGDITRIRCDAWLLPSDRGMHVTRFWTTSAPRGYAWPRLADHPAWGDESQRTLRLEPWPSTPEDGTVPAPVPILTQIGGHSSTPGAWYESGLHHFVHAAMLATSTRTWRAKRLFAVPFVGTGYGGQGRARGAQARLIVDALDTIAREHDVDLVLVLADAAAFSAVQLVRQEKRAGVVDELTLTVERLAALARAGKLVLFLGSGISYPAGIPTWRELLVRLAARFGIAALANDEAAGELSLLDVATLVEAGAASPPVFRGAVAELTSASHHALGHALASSLGCREHVTTNYDLLFEDAMAAAGRDLSVLPHLPRHDSGSWLLKMHGCVTRPGSIVITRSDYMRYQHSRAALSGIVQALLITRHILFVGFSLTDDNFHAVIDAVRRAVDGDVQKTQREPFGTALFLSVSEASERLWRHDIDVVRMTTSTHLADAARRLEIFLDDVVCKATTAGAHLLDENYAELLSDDDREIRDHLRSLEALIGRDPARAAERQPIRELLERLGARREAEIR